MIFLEPLGYIGYYSDRYIQDWPGLVAPEVVHLRHEKHDNFFALAMELNPDWLVVRPLPIPNEEQSKFLKENYDTVRIFDSGKMLDGYGFIPGRNYLALDATFIILKRKPHAG